MTNRAVLEGIKKAFAREKTICRIIAAWASFVSLSAFGEGDFYNLGFAQDTSVLMMLIGILCFFAAFSAISFFLPNYETDSIFLLISSSVCVFFWLLSYRTVSGSFLFLLAVISAYVIFVVYFLIKNEMLLARIRPSRKMTLVFAICIAAISCAVISTITVLRYKSFSSPNFDFGIFCNMFYYMKETGLPYVSSERDMLLSHFAVHISPIYYLILPFYYLFPAPETLQIAQGVILASGIVPVYLLCRHLRLSGKQTMVVSLIYALYPAISCGTFYDIHENCFLAPLLLWVFYFFEKEKYIPMYVFAALVLLVKEDAAIYVLIFALYLLLSRKKHLHGTVLATLSLAYFGFALYMLSNFGMGVMVNRFDNLIFNADDGLWGAVKTALLNPAYLLTQLFTTGSGGYEKLVYFLTLLLPLGFIPFCTRKISRFILITPVLMNLLTYYQYQYDINFQYQFGISAFLIYAVIINLPMISQNLKKYLLSIGVVSVICCYVFMVVPYFNSNVKWYYEGYETHERMEEILETVPSDASVCASTFLIPHLAERDIIYEIAYHNDIPDVDYVIFDMRYGLSAAEIRSRSAYLSQGYEIVGEYENLILILSKVN